jgi:hypothetical protein
MSTVSAAATGRRALGLNAISAPTAMPAVVELRQASYPGAIYKLRYLPATDQLTGDYFQPLYQQTFRVNFLRQ